MCSFRCPYRTNQPLPIIKKVYSVATQNNIKTIERQRASTFNASFHIWVRILWEIHSCNETVDCSPCGAYFTFFRSRCIFSEIMNDLFEWPKSDNGFVDSLIQIYWNNLPLVQDFSLDFIQVHILISTQRTKRLRQIRYALSYQW